MNNRSGETSRPIDMRTVLHEHVCDDLNEVLIENLPFKIPTRDQNLVLQYPTVFKSYESNINCYVESFLKYTRIGDSEFSTVMIDGDWLRIVYGCLFNADFKMNQYDKSCVAQRHDTTVRVCGALALKYVPTHVNSELTFARKELTELPTDTIKVFPKGCNCFVGVISCLGLIQMCIVTYHPDRRNYSAEVHQEYDLNDLPERIRFLVDLMKVCRWTASITGSNSNFHLVPNVRRRTNNKHHITWKVEGILKEFDHKKEKLEQTIQYINQVYSQEPRLLHVEYGRVVDNKSIMITRIGNQLTLANMTSLGVTKEKVIEEVGLGLEELHSIGLAHCDISVSNVYIDDHGVVFLEDLEYLTPINEQPPHYTRLLAGVTPADVESAKHLDEFQYELFRAEVHRM